MHASFESIRFIPGWLLHEFLLAPTFFNHIALDEMGTKIDELEQSVNDLKAEMGTTEVVPVKKPDEAKPADSA